MSKQLTDLTQAKSLLEGRVIRAVEFVSGGTDRDEDDYFIVYVDGLKLYASAPSVYSDDSGDVPAEL
jgi:hypothetical protein